jgi:hypothetical protein
MNRDQKGFSVLEVIIVLIAISLVVGMGWFFYSQQNTKPKTLDTVLSSLNKEARNNFSNAKFEAKNDWGAEAGATAFNKVNGYDYTVSGAGKGLWLAYQYSDKSVTTKRFVLFKKTIPPAKSLAEVKTFVGHKLTSYGFTTTDQKTFNRGSDTCTVLNDPAELQHPGVGSASNLLDVRCVSKDMLQNAAAKSKPFVAQYLQANSNLNASDLAVGQLTIKSKNGAGVIGSSHAAGYDIAEMVVSTKAKKQIALYYTKNSSWHYVTQANDEFGFKCNDMKANADARKAFYDQVCLGENGQVKLDTNNRALQ